MIKAIALDLDRTTLNAEGGLSDGNREAIEYAVSKGMHVIVASGRALYSLPDQITGIQGVEYAVTSNGASVYRLSDGVRLRHYKMTRQSVLKILEVTGTESQSREAAYEVFVDGEAYAQAGYVADPVHFGASPKAVSYIRGSRKPVEDIHKFILEHIEELDSMDVVCREGSVKDLIWERIQREVPDIYMTSSVRQLIEISYKDSGKHMGIKFMADYLGILPKELAAFGDGDNDAEMLREAGIGIAVANASPKCLQAADYIVPGNDEDGVAYGIYTILCAARPTARI